MTFTPLPLPELETDRLLLRGWQPDDFDCVAAIFGDEDNARYIGGKKEPWQAWRHMASLFGHWHLRGYVSFALVEKESGQTIGLAGPWYPEGWPEPEMGWSLHPKAHGKGYATEAAIRCMHYVYDDLGWPTAISLIDGNNNASKHVAEKLGATFESEQTLFDHPAEMWRHLPPEQFRERHS